ncbi:uncharacterized protein LOC135704225 [Ochlerotatus camptorhynchus]|uniref:uncharacterized protein LOC135704225 n=1 Tax=Ochlerotatus camptorhynchus TaxID=644619 RepID=UPI0031D964C5
MYIDKTRIGMTFSCECCRYVRSNREGLKIEKMEVKRIRVTNQKQFAFLVDRMEAHPSVARGQKFCEAAAMDRQKYHALWTDFSGRLNSLGPPTRDVKGWQKVWTDYKNTIKQKLSYNNRETIATGGGPNTMKVLSPTEDAVVKLLTLDKTVNNSGSRFGLPVTVTSPLSPEPGPSQPRNILSSPGPPLLSSTMEAYANLTEVDDPVDEVVEDIENNNNNSSSRTAQRKRRHPDSKDLRYNLLEQQTEYLKKIVENTGECARYSRKVFKLREEEAKQRREYMLQKTKDRQAELEFKIELLKYKKEKLEILKYKECQE